MFSHENNLLRQNYEIDNFSVTKIAQKSQMLRRRGQERDRRGYVHKRKIAPSPLLFSSSHRKSQNASCLLSLSRREILDPMSQVVTNKLLTNNIPFCQRFLDGKIINCIISSENNLFVYGFCLPLLITGQKFLLRM